MTPYRRYLEHRKATPPWWWRPWLTPWFAVHDWWQRPRPVKP